MTEHRKGKRPQHPLNLEDRILWNKVARTVNPLDRARQRAAEQEIWERWVSDAFGETRATPDAPPRSDDEAAQPLPSRSTGHAAPRSRVRSQGPAPLEKPAWRKLARGRTPIDASIDLHHMNQDEAMSQLQRFFVQARARDCRHVLVITGKGRSPQSEGVLRRMLPIWLAQEPFAGLVSGVRPAGRGHGGEGAFYVRLRRRSEPGRGHGRP